VGLQDLGNHTLHDRLDPTAVRHAHSGMKVDEGERRAFNI